jgi:predicted dehydrogenase
MTDTSRTRVAVVGCGFYAQNHLNAWKHLAASGVDLVAVCDIDAAKAEAAGKRFDAAWFTDIEKMLEAVPVDMVDIATRMGTHRQLAAKAADHGIAAIVQKPFAPNWDDCVGIVEHALAKGAWLAVHENFRFTAAMRRVKTVIDSGAIGQPNWARISFRTGFDVYRGQPYLAHEERLLILDVGVHVLDVARWLMGEVEHLACETQRRNPKIKAEDTATMLLRHASGAVSVVDATYEAHRIPDPFPETLLEIEGPEGSIVVTRGERMTVTTQGINFEEYIGSPLLPWTSRPWHTSQEAVLRTNAHMLQCFREGVEAETSGSDSLKTFALVEAAYESAATGKTVRPRVWKQG